VIGRARLLIDLAALAHNLRVAKNAAPTSRVFAVVKADAYGHGLVSAARALGAADGFAVACVGEALALREAGIAQRILVLEGAFCGAELAAAAKFGLELVIHAEWQLQLLEKDGTRGISRLWLKFDTGMHRLGFELDAGMDALMRLRSLAPVPLGLMSHLACADEPTRPETAVQIERFRRLRLQVPDLPGSLANSAGILAFPVAHYEWVRPGLMLYGVSPLSGQRAEALGLRPAMHFGASLIAVKEVAAGEAVGYGGDWRAPCRIRLGIVGAGYGDGYPWRGATAGSVRLHGHRVPIIGRVSMDMLAVNISKIPAAAPGDEVTLWGRGLAVEEVARSAGTTPYELICGVTRRVQRDYSPESSLDPGVTLD